MVEILFILIVITASSWVVIGGKIEFDPLTAPIGKPEEVRHHRK